MKKRLIVILVIVWILIFIGTFCYFNFMKHELTLKKDLRVKINDVVAIKDFIDDTKNIKITNKDEILDTTKVGNVKITIKGKTIFGNKKYDLTVKVIDDEIPKIECTKEFSINSGDQVDFFKNVKVTDNSNEILSPKIEGSYDLNKASTYNLKYVAEDSSGNKAECEFKLIVKENVVPKVSTKSEAITNKTVSNQSYIKINRKQNVVMVYNGDDKLIKTFVCSTGSATPLGTFYTSDKYVWRALYGNVYGQYATRITGSILFHSVPYYKQSKDTLKYEEYNKLGTAASMGCIRLTVSDAKWIYDNLPKKTKVIIYDSDSLEDGIKPTALKIDVNSPNKNWDPTDPDPSNPW